MSLNTPLRAEPMKEALAAARELAMDSAHIPFIADIIDRHFVAMSEDAKRLREDAQFLDHLEELSVNGGFEVWVNEVGGTVLDRKEVITFVEPTVREAIAASMDAKAALAAGGKTNL